MVNDFEVIPHTADLRLRVCGATKRELFRNALVGMFQSIGPRAEGCIEENGLLVCPQLTRSHEIEVDSEDEAALLVDFLSEALALSDIHNEAYLEVQILELSETYIKATLLGVPVQGFEVVEIKAVTYHELAIQEDEGRFCVDIVFDI